MRGTVRAATAAVHDRLHLAPPFLAIAEQRLPMPGYQSLLRRIAAFHFTVGAALGLAGERRELLSRDLESFGAAAPAVEPWNPPSGEAARLGCTYVVEGSALGGKVIYRQLDYLFGDRAHGRRFFGGSPADGRRWRSLCDRLEQEAKHSQAVDQIVSGAQSAFVLFERIVVAAHAHG